MRSALLISLSLLLLGLPAVAANCFDCLDNPCAGASSTVAKQATDGETAEGSLADLPPCHAAMMATATRADSQNLPSSAGPSAPQPCDSNQSVDMSCCDDRSAMPAASMLPGVELSAAEPGAVQISKLGPTTEPRQGIQWAPMARPPSSIYLLNAAWLI